MVNPRDVAGNAEEEEEDNCLHEVGERQARTALLVPLNVHHKITTAAINTFLSKFS